MWLQGPSPWRNGLQNLQDFGRVDSAVGCGRDEVKWPIVATMIVSLTVSRPADLSSSTVGCGVIPTQI